MSFLIPCENCSKEYAQNWVWYKCEKCGFRVCPNCLSNHKGKYSKGGFKCSRCAFGLLNLQK